MKGTLFSRLPWGARTVTSREMRARRSNACVVMPGLALQSPRSDGRAIRIALFRDDCALGGRVAGVLLLTDVIRG